MQIPPKKVSLRHQRMQFRQNKKKEARFEGLIIGKEEKKCTKISGNSFTFKKNQS